VVRAGLLQYRPKVSSPEPWFAALDLFLYAAHYEEFGIVLAEAQAMGVPVLTSRLVGASECLPAVYAPWLVARPEAEPLAAKAVTLLADVPLRRELAAAAARSVTAFDERAYVAGAIELIAAQKRRLK
jgi:UDP-glucose:(heptosyl)LPS alpha-1,3-glucosyltransferase